jgi:hypothetical protein
MMPQLSTSGSKAANDLLMISITGSSVSRRSLSTSSGQRFSQISLNVWCLLDS